MDRWHKVSRASVLDIGLKVLNMLEVIHKAGLVYNDLKFENILLGHTDEVPDINGNQMKSCFETMTLNLIDFGLATEWKCQKWGRHHTRTEVEIFKGNHLFASVNQLRFQRTSRRDDLHALAYMMLFILHGGTFPGFKEFIRCHMINDTPGALLILMLDFKKKYYLTDWCNGNAKDLFRFCYEVQALKYDIEPDYTKLRSILQT